MTAREAAQIIDRIIDPDPWEVCELSDEVKEALDMAIEALQNSPTQMSGTSDLISRKMAIIQLSHNKTGDDDCDVVIQRDIETIKSLSSAQLERKPGKWLIREFGDDAQCSECGMYFKDVYDVDNSDHYCRYCGAKMEGMALRIKG